jgi:acetyltransferase
LNGFRSILPADKSAVVDALVKLSNLAADCPSIAEMEINPLRVLAPGKGAFAVDVRIRLV